MFWLMYSHHPTVYIKKKEEIFTTLWMWGL